MTDTVAVLIPFYGDYSVWRPRVDRAIRSAQDQADLNVYRSPIENLAYARNSAVSSCFHSDWLIFLDADDELSPGYVEAMLAGHGDMRWPSTIGVYEDGTTDYAAVLLEPKGSLLVHNWMVIGTMIRRDKFLEVGGFRDLPILEDWDLWIRMVMAGAQAAPCPDAIYRVHVNNDGRNSNAHLHGHIYSEIQQTYQAEWYSKGLK